MSKNSLQLVILDIGGTVVQDLGQVPAALVSALQSEGISATAGDIQRLRGSSKRKMIAALIAETNGRAEGVRAELVEKIHRTFEEMLLEMFLSGGAAPILGVPACLAWLRENGIAVAATTGFSQRLASRVLAGSGLDRSFSIVVTDDDVRCGRPAPYMIFHAMEQAGVSDIRTLMNVGDTPLDLQSGHNAGLGCVVGVSTGPYSASQLREFPHTHILASAADLPALAEGMLQNGIHSAG